MGGREQAAEREKERRRASLLVCLAARLPASWPRDRGGKRVMSTVYSLATVNICLIPTASIGIARWVSYLMPSLISIC